MAFLIPATFHGQWLRFGQTEARYEYNSNFETYNPAMTWTNIKLDEKRKSIARLKSKCHEKNVTWGESAAEWILHNLHQSAMKTDRNQKKKLASIGISTSLTCTYVSDRELISIQLVAEPNNASSPTRASGKSAMYDPVRDVLS